MICSIDFLEILHNERRPRGAAKFGNGFSEKKFFRADGSIWAKKWCIGYKSGSPLMIFFFWILHNQRAQEIYRNYINGFSGKKFIQGNWVILGPKIVLPYLDFLIFCTIKGAKRYMQIISMVFVKKKVLLGKWVNLDPKIMCRHNSGSALTMFLKFYLVKRVKRYVKIISMVFLKNLSLSQLGGFGYTFALSVFILNNEKDQKVISTCWLV